MAGVSKQSLDAERTVVVLNFPSNVGEDELTIHFQKAKNGGSDVDDVVIHGSVAFVTFDMPQVATSVLRHEQIISGCKLKVKSYNSWMASNKKQHSLVVEESEPKISGNGTGYVSGLKESTTKDAVTLFFQNKKRTGGGDLCEGKEGCKRISDTIARLEFDSSKASQMVLKKASQTPLYLDGNLLKVSHLFEPTHDRSILLAKNLNPKTSKETLQNFVEAKKRADVFNIVYGKGDKAIVILKSEIGEDDSDEEKSSCEDKEMKLDGSIISLEFCPLTNGIQISNIPPETTEDDIKFKFSNRKIGGSKVMDMMFDRKNGVANVFFEESLVVSGLVKQTHTLKNVPLTVIPFYDDFEQQESTSRPEYSGAHRHDPTVFDENTSQLHFTKQFDDPKDATEFERKFVKEEVRIPRGVFERVKEAIEGKRDEYEAEKVDFRFKGLHVILVGKRTDVTDKKKQVEVMIDKFTEEAQKKSIVFPIEDKNKLKFLNSISYFKNLNRELPDVQIHGTNGISGNLSLLGTAEKIRDVKLRILEDLMKISEIEVKMSERQIDFLQRTDCEIVNKELKKDDVMLLLVTIEETEGATDLQANIFSLTKCDNNKRKQLVDIALAKTSEKLKQVDEETANFLAKSDKLQKFKKEQFDKNQVFCTQELANPCNLYIVCEESKMNNAEQDLKSLTDVMKITNNTFRPSDLMRSRFLKEHCWNKITEKEKSLKTEGVAVTCNHDNSLEVKGTRKGSEEMITFLDNLAKNVNSKAYQMTEPGVRKQMTMEATNDIISGIEKNHRCVIEKDIRPDETPEMTKEADAEITGGADGAAGTSGTSTMNLPFNSMSFVNDKEVKMASGAKIMIVVGDLAHQQVDVIVNTTNDSLNLRGNACGKALLKVAGQQLSDECQKIGRLKAGNMASTGPANLNCKRVYHVRSSSWDSGRGALILRQLIKKCLQQARKDKFTSIAIPAIGTGSLHFPREEAAKIFFEEVASYLMAHPESATTDVRFVVYGGDQATVKAFLAAVLEIKSMILSGLSRSAPASTPRNNNNGSRTDAPFTEKPDGTLELFLASSGLTVQIVCDDITNETTNLIMHVITQDFSIQGGVAKALERVGGTNIFQECRTLGKPAPFTTQYTNAGNLAVNQIAHVIAPGSTKVADLQKCVGAFFDDVSTKNITSISLSAVGAGAMGYSETQSADLIFDNLSRISKNKSSSLKLVRIVIFEKPKFLRFKDATKAYFAEGRPTSLNPQPDNSFPSPMATFQKIFRSARMKKIGLIKREGISVKIYSDDHVKIDKAWEELKTKMNENIKEMTMSDDVFKKFTDRDLEKLRQLERDFNFEIKVDQDRGVVKLKGNIADIAKVQGKINEILNDVKDNKSKVPDYWDDIPGNRKFNKVNLSTNHKEYKKVEAAFRKTAPNQIVRIERIQNKEIYELYNVKRQAMMKKYGRNFTGKELMLFHGTSSDNIEKINAGGLNRSYAGMHATAFGKGVYFARDALYSCHTKYSPPDAQGHRYMYYANVLVGEYTAGNRSMIVPPNKNSTDPHETYESVVDNLAKPSMYVLFQDYEYYTEYLITFK